MGEPELLSTRFTLHIKYMRTAVTGEPNPTTYLLVMNHTSLLPTTFVAIAWNAVSVRQVVIF
jgi:hypothetical protein